MTFIKYTRNTPLAILSRYGFLGSGVEFAERL